MSVIIEASATHTASLIFLHGLGDTGYGWAPVMRQLAKRFTFMKFILPHAPTRPVTLNNGFRMPSWYDIKSLSEPDESEDVAGLQASSRTLLDLVGRERQAGIPSERIFIGGFSQGGAVSLFTMLTRPEESSNLAGIIALSAYVPGRTYVKTHSPQPLKLTLPVFIAHGTADRVVAYGWHRDSVQYLKSVLPEATASLTVHTYEGMEHCTCGEEMADLAEFLDRQLARRVKEDSHGAEKAEP